LAIRMGPPGDNDGFGARSASWPGGLGASVWWSEAGGKRSALEIRGSFGPAPDLRPWPVVGQRSPTATSAQGHRPHHGLRLVVAPAASLNVLERDVSLTVDSSLRVVGPLRPESVSRLRKSCAVLVLLPFRERILRRLLKAGPSRLPVGDLWCSRASLVRRLSDPLIGVSPSGVVSDTGCRPSATWSPMGW
jgi:hypothetical protein